jgi:MYXO-CTERM domain-containing protein
MCHNLYSGDWVLPWDGNRIHARYPKIYGIPQAGPDHANRTGTFDNLTYLRRSEAALPRSSFFIVWNSFDGTDPATGAQAYQKLAIVDNLNAFALMNHASIVTRETVAFSLPPTPVTPAPTPPAAPAPSTPSAPATSSSAGGGGGAPSGWFLAALALTALTRLRQRGR